MPDISYGDMEINCSLKIITGSFAILVNIVPDISYGETEINCILPDQKSNISQVTKLPWNIQEDGKTSQGRGDEVQDELLVTEQSRQKLQRLKRKP